MVGRPGPGPWTHVFRQRPVTQRRRRHARVRGRQRKFGGPGGRAPTAPGFLAGAASWCAARRVAPAGGRQSAACECERECERERERECGADLVAPSRCARHLRMRPGERCRCRCRCRQRSQQRRRRCSSRRPRLCRCHRLPHRSRGSCPRADSHRSRGCGGLAGRSHGGSGPAGGGGGARTGCYGGARAHPAAVPRPRVCAPVERPADRRGTGRHLVR